MMRGTYDNSVFLNCPFDATYRPLFEAVTFAVYDCGFFPRCALEVDDGSQVRIEKITSIIAQCRLAVHDISRTELDAVNRLPRFNMPFELGIFVGAKTFGGDDHRRKACIVFDTDRYRYQKFISDIAGQDVREHRCSTRAVIQQLRDFLSAHVEHDAVLPGGRTVQERYREFRAQFARSCADLHLDRGRLTFRDLTVLVTSWIEANPLPHRRATSSFEHGATL